MKKLIMTLAMAFSLSIANAITLFPHFVDVAGDFNDGTTEKFESLNIPVTAWRVSPFFFNKIDNAEEFLKDTLPFSTAIISRESRTLDDGTVIITYVSSLEADGLYKDKYSRLYLVQTPDEPLYVGLYEDQIN